MPQEHLIVPASTVVVFRNGAVTGSELLFVQRSKSLSFAGSAVVFPGGKLDRTDFDHASRFLGLPPEDAAARLAAIRETLEEAGLLLAVHEEVEAKEVARARDMLMAGSSLAAVGEAFGWSFRLDRLVPFARWLPTIHPGRIFDTRFYLADVGSGQMELTPDLLENTRVFWASAQKALDMIETGEIKAIYPTRRNLERLAQFDSFAAASDHAAAVPADTISPWIEKHNGTDTLCIPVGLGYPVTMAPKSQIKIS